MAKKSLFFLVLGIVLIINAISVSSAMISCGGDKPCTICGMTIDASRTFNESDTLTGCTNQNGLSVGANNIVIDCNGYAITGDFVTSGANSGISANSKNNVTIKNCNISGFERGIYFNTVTNSSIESNTISSNGMDSLSSGIYLWSSNNIAVSSNHIFDNDIGVDLRSSTNLDIRNNIVENNNKEVVGWYGYGIYSDWSCSSVNLSSNNVSGNINYGLYNEGVVNAFNGRWTGNGEYAIKDIVPESVHWLIDNYALCKDNNMVLTGSSNIVFSNGGVLELENCTINLAGTIINVSGKATSLDTKTGSGTVKEFEFLNASSNVTIAIPDDSGITITTLAVTPDSGPGGNLKFLKAVEVVVDSDTQSNLNWALIKLFYNESDLASAGISEENLKIYYYNATTSTWNLEANQGVDTVNNYVWANVTHLSLFGGFGWQTQTNGGGNQGSSGGGGSVGCATNWTCTDWSQCSSTGAQTRTCTKVIPYCYAGNKPEEGQICNPELAKAAIAELAQSNLSSPITQSTGNLITGNVIGNSNSQKKSLSIWIIILIGALVLGIIIAYLFKTRAKDNF